jgi:predicted RNA-binding Zn-ribbon protein involved in translation (DUF1610 family)
VLLTQLLKTAKTSNPKATLETVALEAFKAGKLVRLGNRNLTNVLELLGVQNLEYAEIEEPKNFTAGSKQAGQLLFQDRDTSVQVDCPRCATKMRRVKLVDKQAAVYCTQCRHCDFDSSEKSRINAGSPSVEKHLELVCKDAGHCEIKR